MKHANQLSTRKSVFLLLIIGCVVEVRSFTVPRRAETSSLFLRSPSSAKPFSSNQSPLFTASPISTQGSDGEEKSHPNLFRRARRRIGSALSGMKQKTSAVGRRTMLVGMASFLVTMLARPTMTLAMGAMGGSSGPVAPMARKDLLSLSGVFMFLFTVLALLHACEIAITTLYPWKVREIAEEEEKSGKRGTFRVLNEDITRVLTTILVTSTACSIFATTLFTHLVASAFGMRGERYGALALTCLTLFFVELLPKSVGVTNAEAVARIMVPPVNIISTVVSPLGISLSWLAKKTLLLLGLKDKDSGSSITDSQLRLIVTGAKDAGTIDTGEQEMIQGVLELQTRRVKEIMKPRVDVIAIPSTMSVASVLGVVRESGYSRIPVYEGEIDNIVGIVLAKNVLDFFVKGVMVDEEIVEKINKQSTSIADVEEKIAEEIDTTEVKELYSTDELPVNTGTKRERKPETQKYVKSLTGYELASRMQTSISEAGLIEDCYFVPETANGWSVLQEMRKRRVHMAIVVDEYGGTEGLVSLEDIVEEVVGEIYDEDDEEDFYFTEDSISLQEDGSFLIRGDADLEDCDAILNLKLEEEEALKEFSTLSGFLCMVAGEIPKQGDFVMSRGWCFEIMNADEKKILQVKVEHLVGVFDDETEGQDDNNPLRGFLKRNLDADGAEDSAVDDELERTRAANREKALEVERMVDAGKEKMVLIDDEGTSPEN